MTSAAAILFRVDASLEIGNGHVMRCLALARELSDRAFPCRFVCRSMDGHLADLVRGQGHEVGLLPAHFDSSPRQPAGLDWLADAAQTIATIEGAPLRWLIVDHYDLDHRWEEMLAPSCEGVMVIDDLANRHHACNLLLDQNLGRSMHDYHDLVPGGARVLVGPGYALLRPEFAELRNFSLARRRQPGLNTILVSMGGTDFSNASSRLLMALTRWPDSRRCRVIVSLGPQAPWAAKVAQLALEMPFECIVHRDPPNYAQLMADCDLCIGTAGTTSWERCCLGVPSVVACVASNQVMLADQLVASGAALARLDMNSLDEAFTETMSAATRPGALASASRAAAAVCSGLGAKLVADELLRDLAR